jgi:hypothetical protein
MLLLLGQIVTSRPPVLVRLTLAAQPPAKPVCCSGLLGASAGLLKSGNLSFSLSTVERHFGAVGLQIVF